MPDRALTWSKYEDSSMSGKPVYFQRLHKVLSIPLGMESDVQTVRR